MTSFGVMIMIDNPLQDCIKKNANGKGLNTVYSLKGAYAIIYMNFFCE